MLGLSAEQDWLSISADIAQAMTGVVAVIGGGRFLLQARRRRQALEKYLIGERRAAESPGGKRSGTRTIVHLMGQCLMTEAQVLEAAFANSNIKTWVAVDDETGRAETLMFRIDDKAWSKLKNSK